MIRKILAVAAGDVFFMATTFTIFKIAGKDAHADPTFNFAVLTVIFGCIFSLMAGGITQLVGKSNHLKINYILAIIIATFATFSLLKSTGNHWTQLLAIFVLAPISILGGWFYQKRFKVYNP